MVRRTRAASTVATHARTLPCDALKRSCYLLGATLRSARPRAVVVADSTKVCLGELEAVKRSRQRRIKARRGNRAPRGATCCLEGTVEVDVVRRRLHLHGEEDREEIWSWVRGAIDSAISVSSLPHGKARRRASVDAATRLPPELAVRGAAVGVFVVVSVRTIERRVKVVRVVVRQVVGRVASACIAARYHLLRDGAGAQLLFHASR